MRPMSELPELVFISIRGVFCSRNLTQWEDKYLAPLFSQWVRVAAQYWLYECFNAELQLTLCKPATSPDNPFAGK